MTGDMGQRVLFYCSPPSLSAAELKLVMHLAELAQSLTSDRIFLQMIFCEKAGKCAAMIPGGSSRSTLTQIMSTSHP